MSDRALFLLCLNRIVVLFISFWLNNLHSSASTNSYIIKIILFNGFNDQGLISVYRIHQKFEYEIN
jgi:hypothetical protein